MHMTQPIPLGIAAVSDCVFLASNIIKKEKILSGNSR